MSNTFPTPLPLGIGRSNEGLRKVFSKAHTRRLREQASRHNVRKHGSRHIKRAGYVPGESVGVGPECDFVSEMTAEGGPGSGQYRSRRPGISTTPGRKRQNAVTVGMRPSVFSAAVITELKFIREWIAPGL